MGTDYYLIRDDNKTRFDIGKAYEFAEFWQSEDYDAQWNEFTLDTTTGPFLRSMREQLKVYGLADAAIDAAMIRIEYFADDQPVVLMSIYGKRWREYREVGSVFDPTPASASATSGPQ